MAKEKQEALAKIEDQYPMLADTDTARGLAEVIEVNLGGMVLSQFDLQRIHVPGQGSVRWIIDGVDDTPAEVEGIIMAIRVGRNYWKTSFDVAGGGSPPDCSSQDGIQGHGNPGGNCASCPLSQFGSAKDGQARGQACRQVAAIFIVQPGMSLPSLIIAPPTSIGELKKFLVRLTSSGVAYTGTTTKLRLTPTKNKEGIPYAQITPSMGSKLLPEQSTAMKAYSKAMAPLISSLNIDERAQDFNAVGDESGQADSATKDQLSDLD